MEIREYFETALRMEVGEKLIIPVPDKGKQHSVRVNLLSLKRKFTQVSPQLSEQISVHSQTIDNPDEPGTDLLVVIVEKTTPNLKPFIMQGNGKIRKVISKGVMTKLERLIDRAIEDGLTIEDILNQVSTLFPEDEIRKEWKKQLKERGE